LGLGSVFLDQEYFLFTSCEKACAEMPFSSRCQQDPNQTQDSSSEYDSLPEVSILDVYDLASDIGKEFEKMISLHGSEMVQGLMPKVVGVLELLEKISTQSEQERQTVEELRNTISLLEHEKREKAIDRLRYEKEIEQLEENWKKESHELLQTISRLQEQNKKLQSSLKEREELDKSIPRSPIAKEPDWDLFEKIRESNEKQREQLREKEKELQDKVSEAETLQSQVDRLTDSNRELRRKTNHVQQQLRSLVEERADLQAMLQESSKTVTALNKRLGVAQRDNQDLVQSQTDTQEKEKSKAIADVNDPNKPRFTVSELKEILCERNELKARVSDLEDELSMYRPKGRTQVAKIVPSVDNAESAVGNDWTDLEGEEADLPVQGPLPYEPEDAPWRRSKKSGIRKLFKKFFPLPGALSAVGVLGP